MLLTAKETIKFDQVTRFVDHNNWNVPKAAIICLLATQDKVWPYFVPKNNMSEPDMFQCLDISMQVNVSEN
ncbi:Uncharacterised protein [Yersinia mollaretii]|uniref:hypothetical protein n=1 Tax=Yersinia mollaretii TaxID=33060 RepID=UPI0005DB6207|nr:hypothetical protein [Yersinia mollaretii]CNL04657.1 Uncharacterised protein [Yersinia mollaretii]